MGSGYWKGWAVVWGVSIYYLCMQIYTPYSKAMIEMEVLGLVFLVEIG